MPLSNSKKLKLCPKCGAKVTGPYPRYVLNSQGKRYDGYLYFKHSEKGVKPWHYLGKGQAKGGKKGSGKVAR